MNAPRCHRLSDLGLLHLIPDEYTLVPGEGEQEDEEEDDAHHKRSRRKKKLRTPQRQGLVESRQWQHRRPRTQQ